MSPEPTLESLRDALRRFAEEREWERFHSPKNLAIALLQNHLDLSVDSGDAQI